MVQKTTILRLYHNLLKYSGLNINVIQSIFLILNQHESFGYTGLSDLFSEYFSWILDIVHSLIESWYFGQFISLSEPVSSCGKLIIESKSVLEATLLILHNLQVSSLVEQRRGNCPFLRDTWQVYFVGIVMRPWDQLWKSALKSTSPYNTVSPYNTISLYNMMSLYNTTSLYNTISIHGICYETLAKSLLSRSQFSYP